MRAEKVMTRFLSFRPTVQYFEFPDMESFKSTSFFSQLVTSSVIPQFAFAAPKAFRCDIKGDFGH